MLVLYHCEGVIVYRNIERNQYVILCLHVICSRLNGLAHTRTSEVTSVH